MTLFDITSWLQKKIVTLRSCLANWSVGYCNCTMVHDINDADFLDLLEKEYGKKKQVTVDDAVNLSFKTILLHRWCLFGKGLCYGFVLNCVNLPSVHFKMNCLFNLIWHVWTTKFTQCTQLNWKALRGRKRILILNLTWILITFFLCSIQFVANVI